jgi:hypothetical protein
LRTIHLTDSPIRFAVQRFAGVDLRLEQALWRCNFGTCAFMKRSIIPFNTVVIVTVLTCSLTITKSADAGSAGTRPESVQSPAALKHRYSFATDASDSVGQANGTLEGAAAVRDGQVHLNGTRGTYVNLPGGLIAGHPAVTFEFWATLGTNKSWPRSGAKDFRLTIMDPHPTERVVTIPGNLDNQTNLHVACVLDPASGFMGIYTNGVLAGSRKDLTSLSSVDTNLFFLGRSLFASDAPLNGSIGEFRIYNGALSAAQVAASYILGPIVAVSPAGTR